MKLEWPNSPIYYIAAILIIAIIASLPSKPKTEPFQAVVVGNAQGNIAVRYESAGAIRMGNAQQIAQHWLSAQNCLGIFPVDQVETFVLGANVPINHYAWVPGVFFVNQNTTPELLKDMMVQRLLLGNDVENRPSIGATNYKASLNVCSKLVHSAEELEISENYEFYQSLTPSKQGELVKHWLSEMTKQKKRLSQIESN